ncbi:MAG: ADP-ribosylglycohydrolase family protein [Actinocatenispora sp.]
MSQGTDTRATGCLLGLAYGDALGAPTEFLDVDAIVQRYGPGGPRELTGDPALITDDTQMTLAVARALRDADALTPERIEPALREHFVRWWASPDNTRAPGMTCLRACAKLADGTPWRQATGESSKGCGANMRVAPVGLLPGIDDTRRAGLAQFQAALTHGHPTGLAASDLTAFAVHQLRAGLAPAALSAALRERCRQQRRTYHEEWLADLWTRPGVTDPVEFIARGWDECLDALDALETALARPDRDTDPCRATGAGWIAEEALATALHCFLLFPEDPVGMLARAATTSGDSDSIACLAGAFAGAAYGADAWPAHWARTIEHGAELAEFGRRWDARHDQENQQPPPVRGAIAWPRGRP